MATVRPSGAESRRVVFEAGRVRSTPRDVRFHWPVRVMWMALTVESSISRIIHQAPTTIALRGPTGPPGDQGVGSPGSEPNRAKGSGCASVAGPSPRSQLRMASLSTRFMLSSHPCPLRWASALYNHKYEAADR